MNVITLVGRLTADVKMEHTTTGKAVGHFTLAVQRRFKKDEADFIRCVAWEKRAEIISQYVKKGQQLALTGSLQIRQYEDKEGNKRSMTEVLVDNITFIGGATTVNTTGAAVAPINKNTPASNIDDEFPF